MTREIKFRAWDAEEKCFYMSGGADDLGLFFSSFSLPIHQFTGLKDKNGVEIYEGDIIRQNIQNRFGSYSKKNVSVFWNEGKASFWTEIPLNDRDAWTIGKNCEVIGNIYQNPELLK